jgi:hypothetical protein
MFSYFNGGIKNIYPKRHIDLPSLVRLIKNNPEKNKIEKIRELRRSGLDYSSPKSYLPYITPNSLVRIRNLKDSDYNLITPSSYVYIDIDDYPNSQKLKDRFIEEYGHFASLICLSCSSGGISILFKVSNLLKTENDFQIARHYILDNIIVGEKNDENVKDIARAMFISSDPDVFYNYENEIEIPAILFKRKRKENEKCLKESKKSHSDMIRIDCTSLDSFIPTPIDEVLAQLIFETPVNVENPVVDYKEVDYVEVRFKYLIKDGLKHRTFTSMLHKLLFLNPTADRQLLLSYLFHVNDGYTGNKKMSLRELIGLFETVYYGANVLGNSNVKPDIKRIHYNKNCEANFSKRKVSGKIRGAIQKNQTKLKLKAIIEEMEEKGLSLSKSSISKHSGIHRDTIREHVDSDLIDIDKLIREINDSIE